MKEIFGASSSAIFVAPYGLLQKPTTPDAEIMRLREFCSGSGLQCLEIDASGSKGKLICSSKNLSPVFAFVLQEKEVNLSRKRFLLDEVFVPNADGPSVKLMPKIVGGCKGKLPVFFDISKYNAQASADAFLATWHLGHA